MGSAPTAPSSLAGWGAAPQQGREGSDPEATWMWERAWWEVLSGGGDLPFSTPPLDPPRFPVPPPPPACPAEDCPVSEPLPPRPLRLLGSPLGIQPTCIEWTGQWLHLFPSPAHGALGQSYAESISWQGSFPNQTPSRHIGDQAWASPAPPCAGGALGCYVGAASGGPRAE